MTEVETQDAEVALPDPVVTVEDAGPARKRLKIEVPAERVVAKLEDNFGSLREEAQVPGFRQGRTPRKLLEKRFGREVRAEACNQLVGEGYTHAIEKHELRVLGEPEFKELENIKLPDSGSLSFEVEIEVVPEVTLPDLKGFEVKKPLIEVGEDKIDAEVNRFCEMYGRFEPVDSAKARDYITADVVVREAGGSEALAEYPGTQALVPGEERKFKGAVAGILVEDLGKSLDGQKAGAKVVVKAKGPAQHEDEKLRDKDLEIELSLSRIERLTPLKPEQLGEQMGLAGVDELRGQVKERLEGQATITQQQAMAQQIGEALVDQVKMEALPENLSARQADRALQNRAMELMYRGVQPDEIEQQLAELRASSQEQAQRELKRLFVLDAAARSLEIEVSEAEVNGRIVQIAAQQGKRPERVREELSRNGQIESLFIQVREEKTLGRLLEDAKVV